MPRQKHYYGENHLHYLTKSTYHRTRLFDSDQFRQRWVETQGGLRSELDFKIAGYVLMPEHFHLLIWPSPDANPSQMLQKLEGRMALFILKNLKENPKHRWCRKMLDQVRLPATVHHHAHFRVWQRGGYDMNIWSSKKINEKLDYMHNNPVVRKLVAQPGDWPWSSWRFYYLNDTSLLPMDPEEPHTSQRARRMRHPRRYIWIAQRPCDLDLRQRQPVTSGETTGGADIGF